MDSAELVRQSFRRARGVLDWSQAEMAAAISQRLGRRIHPPVIAAIESSRKPRTPGGDIVAAFLQVVLDEEPRDLELMLVNRLMQHQPARPEVKVKRPARLTSKSRRPAASTQSQEDVSLATIEARIEAEERQDEIDEARRRSRRARRSATDQAAVGKRPGNGGTAGSAS